MALDNQASEDFERAFYKGFRAKILRWLTGESNELLPFNAVKERVPVRGQYDRGLMTVPIDQIVGSMGRYRDFDRAFLPLQRRTKDRWVSIDKAHYQAVALPPVELLKMGEVYFVRDGNHRVSVARERGQEFVDAYVTEIDILVPLTPQTSITDLDLQVERARFIELTQLPQLRPQAHIEMTIPGEYERLLEHISVHRWYLGEQKHQEVAYTDAVISWYDNVYAPLARIIEENDLIHNFPARTVADLYLWIIEYQWYRREAYKANYSFADASRQFVRDFDEWPAGKLVNLLKRAAWVDYYIIEQERAGFLARTHLDELQPGEELRLTVPGMYDKLLEHIDVHRWYLGEKQGGPVPYPEAVLSWYKLVYCPLVEEIRAQEVLHEFPGRTETDLYLWIIENREDILP